MPSLLLYGIVALGIIGSLGGIGWKVNHDGYVRGKAEIQQQWDAANVAAQQKAEADRKRQDDLRAAQDKEATRRLANAKQTNQRLMASLEAHIRAAGTSVACAMPPDLLRDWNAANSGGEGERPGAVPATGRTPTTTH